MKLVVGKNTVRVLPPPVGKTSPFVTVVQHFINIPGRAIPLVFNCPRAMVGKPCPACAKKEQLTASMNPVDQESARDFWASRRVFAPVIDRSDETAGPKILGFGKTVHEQLLLIRKNPDIGGDFTHPETGFDLDIYRKGMGMTDTKYNVQVGRSQPLGNMEWLKMIPDLTSLTYVQDWQEIVAMVKGDAAPHAAAQVTTAIPQALQTYTASPQEVQQAPNDIDIPF
jgi:hypothetical protein